MSFFSGSNAQLSSHCQSIFHIQSQRTSALWSVLGWRSKSSLSSVSREKTIWEKCKPFFFFTTPESNILDVSTESFPLQPLLPDALIESAMSNRKRNKCFIELECSLVIVGGKAERQPAAAWVLIPAGKGIPNPRYQHFLRCSGNN